MAECDEFAGHRVTQRAGHQVRVPLQQLGHQMNVGVRARRHPDTALLETTRRELGALAALPCDIGFVTVCRHAALAAPLA